MTEFVFPSFDHRITKKNDKAYIYDIVRKKNVFLSPEEWVRQHLVHYLIHQRKYPKSLIRVEDGLKMNKMQKRSDVLVYDRNGEVFLVVECKSFKVRLNQRTSEQLSSYNQHYRSKYLAVTNGKEVYIFEMDYNHGAWTAINNFPEYK